MNDTLKPVTAQTKRINFHEVTGIAESLMSQRKNDLGKRVRSVAFQLLNDEAAFRRLREKIVTDAPKEDLLKVIDAALGKQDGQQ
jgi:hypothetical protein